MMPFLASGPRKCCGCPAAARGGAGTPRARSRRSRACEDRILHARERRVVEWHHRGPILVDVFRDLPRESDDQLLVDAVRVWGGGTDPPWPSSAPSRRTPPRTCD
eukprot:617335-Pyramimonas_sp.AAC.1